MKKIGPKWKIITALVVVTSSGFAPGGPLVETNSLDDRIARLANDVRMLELTLKSRETSTADLRSRLGGVFDQKWETQIKTYRETVYPTKAVAEDLEATVGILKRKIAANSAERRALEDIALSGGASVGRR